MWFYYSEKSKKRRDEAERERNVKKKQTEFELDDSEFATDNHLYIVYFFGRIFYRYILYFRLTIIILFILGLYFPIFHLFIIWKYITYSCEFMVLDEEINFDFHDEAVQIILLTRHGGYLGFENIHICMIYDELGYAYWDVDVLHDLRSDRYYLYNLSKNWLGFSNNYSIIDKNKYLNLKKENKWIKLYVKEKINIKNNKEKIKNFIKLNKLLFKRRHLLKINKIRNEFFFLFKKKKIHFSNKFNDYLPLNRNRGLSKSRFLNLGYNNYYGFGSVHNINKKYIYENKNDDYNK